VSGDEFTQDPILVSTSREIDKTRTAISQLKEQRASLIVELKNLRAQRRGLIDEIRKLRNEYKSLREKYGKLVEERRRLVGELKAKREEYASLIELARSKKIEVDNLSREVKLPISVIVDEINKLEWSLQTRVLTLEQENEIINKIKRYEQLLDKARKAVNGRNEYLELKAYITSLKVQIADLRNKIKTLSDEVSRHREMILKLRQEIAEKSSSITQLTSMVKEKQKSVEDLNKEIEKNRVRLGELREEYNKRVQELKKAKASKILEEKRRAVEERLRSGVRKLTLEDLKLLYSTPEELEEDG